MNIIISMYGKIKIFGGEISTLISKLFSNLPDLKILFSNVNHKTKIELLSKKSMNKWSIKESIFVNRFYPV